MIKLLECDGDFVRLLGLWLGSLDIWLVGRVEFDAARE